MKQSSISHSREIVSFIGRYLEPTQILVVIFSLFCEDRQNERKERITFRILVASADWMGTIGEPGPLLWLSKCRHRSHLHWPPSDPEKIVTAAYRRRRRIGSVFFRAHMHVFPKFSDSCRKGPERRALICGGVIPPNMQQRWITGIGKIFPRGQAFGHYSYIDRELGTEKREGANMNNDDGVTRPNL